MIRFSTVIEEAVEDVMRAVLRFSAAGTRLKSRTKSDGTFVTELDMLATEMLEERLGELLPIVSEERKRSHLLIEKSENFLVVDPIDGTTALRRYVRGSPTCAGFGPLVGVVFDGVLTATVFGDISTGELVTAEVGCGVTVRSLGRKNAKRLKKITPTALHQSAMIMNLSSADETLLAYQLRDQGVIEAVYRYGAIANDCMRIARGLEEIHLQLRLKPWDFAAVLLAAEAGAQVMADPLDRQIQLSKWRVSANNPVLVANTTDNRRLIKIVKKLLSSSMNSQG